MKLSIIVPILNEESNLERLIDNLLKYSPLDKEILLVDGGSTDNTISIIEKFTKTNTNIIYLNNTEKYAANAFNQAYKVSKGEFIAFIGAHAVYSQNYFERAIELIKIGKADVVGGVLGQVGKGEMGKIIARCMSSKFGVGDTEFRTSTEEQLVQSVAFAIYKREVIEKVGLMNTKLIRNQDDEFHYRVVHHGYKILMTNETSATYIVRSSIKRLFLQYYEYGLYKPLVFKNVKSGMRLRHLIPSCFFVYLFLLIISVFFVRVNYILSIPLILYIILNVYFSFKIHNKTTEILKSIVVFFTLHIAYGLGFLIGIKKIY